MKIPHPSVFRGCESISALDSLSRPNFLALSKRLSTDRARIYVRSAFARKLVRERTSITVVHVVVQSEIDRFVHLSICEIHVGRILFYVRRVS